MNRMQKIAVFNLAVLGVAVSASAGAFIILALVAKLAGHGIDKACYSALAFLGIFGIAGLSPLIFKKDKGKVTHDERDTLIERTSALGGFAASYLFFIVACMLSWGFFRHKGTIPADIVVLFPIGGLIVVEVVRSTILLTLYRRGQADGE